MLKKLLGRLTSKLKDNVKKTIGNKMSGFLPSQLRKKKSAIKKIALSSGCAVMGCIGPALVILIVVIIIGIGIFEAIMGIGKEFAGLVKAVRSSYDIGTDPQLDAATIKLQLAAVDSDRDMSAYEYALIYNDEDDNISTVRGEDLKDFKDSFDEASMSYDAFGAFVTAVSRYEDIAYDVNALRYLPHITRTWTAEEYAKFVEAANKMLESRGATPIKLPRVVIRQLRKQQQQKGQ